MNISSIQSPKTHSSSTKEEKIFKEFHRFTVPRDVVTTPTARNQHAINSQTRVTSISSAQPPRRPEYIISYRKQDKSQVGMDSSDENSIEGPQENKQAQRLFEKHIITFNKK